LNQTVDQVHSQVSEILLNSQDHRHLGNGVLDDSHRTYHSQSSLQGSEASIVHKDILVDSAYVDPERSGEETSLSTEVQIQRLTAQLTAAYNRIAALEEQLLASRVY
ncbi:MAG: hypothetical protein AAFQ89_00130, partial [Cyanobacteria bacterium J06626_18]